MSLTLNPQSLVTQYKIRLDSLARTSAGNKAHALKHDFVPWVVQALEQGLPIDTNFLRQRILSACYNISESKVVKILERNGL